MFGERASPIPIQEWGHPEGIWTDKLVKVPWLEVPYKERRIPTLDNQSNQAKKLMNKCKSVWKA